MVKIKNISGFVKTFENADEETLKLTVEELVNKYKDQLEIDKTIQENKEKLVIDKYKDIYLKKYNNDEDALFGEELEIIYIKDVTVSGFTDEYERTYLLNGNSLRFSHRNVYLRQFDDSLYSLKTETELETYTVISKNEYDAYMEEYTMINSTLKRIIRDGK
jgi:ribosomal protein S17E